MSTTTRCAALLILSSLAFPARAQDGIHARPVQEVAWNQGHAHVTVPAYAIGTADPQAIPASTASGYSYGYAHAPAAPAGDPYGFAAILNRYRALAGLPPVAYDPDLSSWASQNNAAQSRRGLGHHINPNCFQNCGWNYADVWSVARGWMNSPGHRQNMLAPSITRFGIAYGPGPYWTMNAR